MNEPQISTSVLFTGFLGLTESQIDGNNPFGSALKKVGKQDLEANMQIILYALSQEQYFEAIVDKDQNGIVVSQKTYWTDIEQFYEMMKKKSIPWLKCGYSDGFYIESPQFEKILFELVSYPGRPTCILTSI
ncbi:hypothetical protein LX69_00571 [Breznakibacter xylanolyticus]|uniref:Uncharacterized protein n=1 Tax=Breznakibacter xylanolyticus TaxID=990 RepID=A0A2W7NIP8_9BACT|nr:hypothetical protein [Breznakibacter xylanolyticus]PZX20118.1 hypothetical protein LX69_00571 [Breznakibacter xylanolyticus]